MFLTCEWMRDVAMSVSSVEIEGEYRVLWNLEHEIFLETYH